MNFRLNSRSSSYPELFYSLTLLAAVLTSLWCKTAEEVMSLHCDDLSTDESLFKVTSVCYSSLQVLLETSPHQFPVAFPVCSAADWNRKQYFSIWCRKHEGLKTNTPIWGEFVRKRLKSGFMLQTSCRRWNAWRRRSEAERHKLTLNPDCGWTGQLPVGNWSEWKWS